MAKPTNTQRIGRRITAARQFRGWELDELATRSGITRQRLTRYETTGNLSCDELERLVAALRFPVDHFLGACVLCGMAARAS